MKRYETNGYKRITKTTARKLFNNNVIIYLLPCKASLNSYWFSPYEVCKIDMVLNDTFSSFDAMINSFEYYNCNSETGKYTAFYIKA